jgi:hypothetical protein
MADKDFVVKNGLVVNTNFSTNGSQITLSTINSTSNGFLATTTSITVGNLTVNSIITPTTFSGKSADSDKLGGVAAGGYLTTSGVAADSTRLGGALSTAYVNTTGTYTISGVHTHSANIVITNPAGISVNSSYGTAGQFLTTNGTSAYWSSQKLTSNNNGGTGAIQLNDAGNLGSNSSFLYNQSTNTVTIGNTSVSSTINSTVYTGTSNNALYLGNQLAAYYVNSSSLTTTLIPYVNTSQLSANLANYVNTTATAFDSARLGGVVAANYVANSGNYTIGGALTFINSSIHTGNVTISNSITANNNDQGAAGQVLTSGGANKNVYWTTVPNVASQYAWTNTHSFANVVTFNGNAVFANAISANGGYGTLGQQLISGGTGANAYWGFAPGANTAGGGGAVQFWNGTTFGSTTGLSFAATGNNLSVTNSISIGGVSINSTSYGGKSADSDKLGTVAAASYALKADVHFIGTTSVALNRASAALNLAGVNIDGSAATITGVYAGSLTSSQITTALTYTPYNSTNPAGYTTNLGTVTQVTGTSPLSSSGGTTPAISIAQAGIAASGFLSSTDWNTFNNKQATLSAATSSVSGYLSSADWSTFNGKQAALGFTPAPAQAPVFTGAVKFANSYYMNVVSIATGSPASINLSLGNYFTYTASGTTTFTPTNIPASGNLVTFAIKIYGGGVSAPTITWMSGTRWPSAVAPAASSNTDLWVFMTDDGGTNWRGQQVMKDSR